MGRGPWTEEQRAKHAATIAARKATQVARELAPLTTRTMLPRIVDGSVIAQIDEEIRRREEELEALRTTRTILERPR